MALSEDQRNWLRQATANLRRCLTELEAAKGRPELNTAATEQLISEVKRRIAELDDRLRG
jgi:DNA repair exonuclease SbcCD ATPase subunit